MQDRLSIIVWRDSVCAGDDGDAPHEVLWAASREVSLRGFLEELSARRYLASVSGGRATWVLDGTRPLAVLAQQWVEPRFLVAAESPLASLIDPGVKPHLHWRYCTQMDPDRVFSCLSRGEPLPGR